MLIKTIHHLSLDTFTIETNIRNRILIKIFRWQEIEKTYMQEKIPFEKLGFKLSPKRTHLSVPNAVLALHSKPFSLTALVNLIKLTNT